MATGGELVSTHAKEIAGRKLATRVSTAHKSNVTSGQYCNIFVVNKFPQAYHNYYNMVYTNSGYSASHTELLVQPHLLYKITHLASYNEVVEASMFLVWNKSL